MKKNHHPSMMDHWEQWKQLLLLEKLFCSSCC
jgi:hypothetical protein